MMVSRKKVSTENGWDGVTTVNNYTGENFNVVFSLANYWEGGYNPVFDS